MDGPLYNFGDYRNDGYGPEVGWVRRIAGFVNGVNEGVFPGLGDIRERDMLELTKCRSTGPIASNDIRTMRIEMPSSPLAADPLILNTVVRSSDSVRGDRMSAQAPTRGSLQGR